MLDFFTRYKAACNRELSLILTGKAAMKIPERPDIRMLGFVTEEDKFNAMSAASVFVMPSQMMESLSIVILEAWSVDTPALVNGNCAVLPGGIACGVMGACIMLTMMNLKHVLTCYWGIGSSPWHSE